MSDWKAELDDFFNRQERLRQAEEASREQARQELELFIVKTVLPAYVQLQEYLETRQREIRIAADHEQATLTVLNQGNPEIMYRVYARLPQPAVQYAFIAAETGRPVEATDAITDGSARPMPLAEITQDDIIGHFIRKYKSVAA